MDTLCQSGKALQALSGEGSPWNGKPPAWDLLRSVTELRPVLHEAFGHVRTLSFEAFGRQVMRADEWSLARAAKNTLREARKYLFEDYVIDGDEEDEPSGQWPNHPMQPPRPEVSLQRLAPSSTPYCVATARDYPPTSA